MNIFITIILFVAGLAFGSFVNALVYRIKNKQNILKGRSKCPQCGKTLSALELIPLLSFVMQRGRCRQCNKKISWSYPIFELVAGIIFALEYVVLQPEYLNEWFRLTFYLLLSIILIAIFLYDFKYYLIPDALVIPGVIIALIINIYLGQISISNIIIGSLGAAGFFLFFVLISKEKWMGWGDVKLGFFIGAICGWPLIIPCLFIAFIFGALAGLMLVFLKKKSMKSAVPFGTFLTLSTILTMLWGQDLLNWYLDLIGF